MKMDPGGGWRHPQGGRDVSHGSVGVVMQDDGCTLVDRELTEEGHKLPRSLLARVGDVRQPVICLPPSLELPRGDSEGDTPDPRQRITDVVAGSGDQPPEYVLGIGLTFRLAGPLTRRPERATHHPRLGSAPPQTWRATWKTPGQRPDGNRSTLYL